MTRSDARVAMRVRRGTWVLIAIPVGLGLLTLALPVVSKHAVNERANETLHGFAVLASIRNAARLYTDQHGAPPGCVEDVAGIKVQSFVVGPVTPKEALEKAGRHVQRVIYVPKAPGGDKWYRKADPVALVVLRSGRVAIVYGDGEPEMIKAAPDVGKP